ncbi:hypothetical protein [Herbiconiux sp. YIM B11900]|uniref:hypothetical protein n=1 Tax=Herbiconiux sp. YIM B11900 TaxID=3404131 RepID=UPI003F87ACAB
MTEARGADRPDSEAGAEQEAGTGPEAGAGEEVDSFDRELEEKIHTFIASATPTDGPAPGA